MFYLAYRESSESWLQLENPQNSCMTPLITCISFILLNAPSRKQSTMWYQSKTMHPNQNGIQKWRMVLFCLVLRSSTGCTAFQLQLLHHSLHCSTKGHAETTGEISTPPVAEVKGHRLVFVEAPSLLEHLPPLSLLPLSCRQENGCSAWAKSSKADREKKKQSFSKGRGGEWVSCLIHHSSSPSTQTAVLRSAE